MMNKQIDAENVTNLTENIKTGFYKKARMSGLCKKKRCNY